MRILITGGAGFIGSHLAEYYAQDEEEVFILDNLSRPEFVLKKGNARDYNWNYLEKYSNVALIPGDIRDYESLEAAAEDVDLIFNCAAQTQSNASIGNPINDISCNVLGAFNVLEVARRAAKKPTVIHCSTSRIYGINVNRLPVKSDNGIFRFTGKDYEQGIAESFPVDGHGHTPFGVSKLSADIYMQEYAHLYGLKIGVFRLSTVYGPRHFGIEEQGWMGGLVLDTILGRPATIYGDGDQTRDPVYITDVINAFDTFIQNDLRQGVFNIGGGADNLLSPVKLLDILEEKTGKRSSVRANEHLPYEQRAYYSNLTKIGKMLNWQPTVNIIDGLDIMIKWVKDNMNLFS